MLCTDSPEWSEQPEGPHLVGSPAVTITFCTINEQLFQMDECSVKECLSLPPAIHPSIPLSLSFLSHSGLCKCHPSLGSSGVWGLPIWGWIIIIGWHHAHTHTHTHTHTSLLQSSQLCTPLQTGDRWSSYTNKPPTHTLHLTATKTHTQIQTHKLYINCTPHSALK